MELTRERIEKWRGAFQYEFCASAETNTICDLALSALDRQCETCDLAERLEASQGGYRSCYEMVKQFDVYGTGGDVSSCIREMLQRMQELTAGWKKCEDHLKIVATEFLESVDEELIPHEDRSQATFEDAVKVARQSLIHTPQALAAYQASETKP